MRIYMLKRYKERKKRALKFLGGCCKICSSQEKLEFDHADPKKKKFTIAKFWSYSEKIFWDEVKKCQLLCKQCHVKKTAKYMMAKHGTISRYVHRKKPCRCIKCTQAYKDWHAEYRKRNKK